MNWCLVKIALVTCALVLCVSEEISSEEESDELELENPGRNFNSDQSDSYEDTYSERDYAKYEEDPDHDDYYNEDDEERRKHHHGHGSHHHGSHYVIPVTQKPRPPPTTEKGPIPLPNPIPKSCPRYEEYHDCGSPCQVECSNLGQKCQKSSARCSDGCYCIPGFARKYPNGPCVPQSKCPQPYCPDNEVWLDCYQAPPCDRECSRLGKPCDRVGGSCNAGCFCRYGYARDSNTGECVSIGRCSAPEPQCAKYEEYRTCGYRCKEDCDSSSCKYDKRPCEKGCFCQPGYARHPNSGVCVPSSKCPAPEPQCSSNEEFKYCGYRCSEDCDSTACKYSRGPCEKGCFCRPGYARHPNSGTCVPSSKCPAPEPQCSSYEEYRSCGYRCSEDCDGTACKYNKGSCEKGCFCRPGYARHPDSGSCVPKSKCPVPEPQCSSNEEFRSCGYRCTEDCDSESCKYDRRPCEKGCFCALGYARIDGNCVPKSSCKTCPDYETYLKCGNSCMESCYEDSSKCRTCERSGCFCIDGYSRINGVCRPDKECPNKQCPAFEVYLECGSSCQDNCDKSQVCADVCVPGCYCAPGYARVDGKCVPRKKCPAQCPENEHYLSCGNNCIDHCDRDRLDCPPDCIPGCYCNNDYARINGKCVPRKQCTQCKFNEEYLTCGNACQDLCDTSAVRCTDECIQGCFCKTGYSRINGVCVPRSKCFQCAAGEEYTNCGNSCLERCDRATIACPFNCEEGCFCASGFSRISGKCLPNEFCPKCGKNEEYQFCGNHCLEKCGSNDCPTDLVCSGGCYCKKGFKRDGKVCVPEAQCPAKCEGPNEAYSTCGNDCTDLCPDPNRLCTQECYGGCFCAEGYSRVDYSSPCIPTDECPKTCPGKNEQYYECGNSCFDSCPDPSQNCNLNCVQGCFCSPNYARLVPGGPCVPNTKCPNPCPRPFEELNNCGNNCTELCPRYGRVCDRNCWKDCFCEDGYYRPGYNEPCIPKSKCPVLPVCKGPNEEIRDCGSRCDDDCPGIIYECPNDCQVGCYCKPGFKRLTRDGQCVPVDKCPSVCTKANEEFTECGSPCREACQYPDALCTDECYLGCYCQAGYSRINGECVPSSECPSVCSDPNEFYTQCGNRCGELCNSVNCPTVCEVGCFCKPGFKRDSSGGKCIPEKQCTLSCTKPNEEYTDCGNPCTEGCPYPTRVCPAVCYTGCYCKAGYSRIKGKCVSSSNCPNLCTNPNEVFSECGSHCAEECNSEACPEICETGCFCQPGYSRKDGVCVPTEECPPKCEGFNEVYTDCGSSCREQCGQKYCPDICEEGCFCAPGYSRIKGVCTETISCPKCAKNEEYTYCASGCTDPCNLKDALCKDVCREGCFCKDNYSRVTPGAPCIPDSQCPDIPPPVTNATCGQNEVYTVCGRACQTICDNLGTECQIVNIRCPDGCYCAPGYARVFEGGCCVEQSICPVSPCGDHELWLECGEPRQAIPCPQRCEDVGKKCIEEYPQCSSTSWGGCYCEPGYSRTPDGTMCIPSGECSSWGFLRTVQKDFLEEY